MILDFNRVHPELEEEEVFLVNVLDPVRFPTEFLGGDNYYFTCPYNTKRLGEIGYDKRGHIEEDFLPIFVQRSELESLGIDLEDPFNFPHGVKIEDESEVSFNDTHPELREGEVFLFNASDIPPYPDEDPFVLCRLETKRLGTVAYKKDGTPLLNTRPVFGMKWEVDTQSSRAGIAVMRCLDSIFSNLGLFLDKRLEKRILKKAQKIRDRRR